MPRGNLHVAMTFLLFVEARHLVRSQFHSKHHTSSTTLSRAAIPILFSSSTNMKFGSSAIALVTLLASTDAFAPSSSSFMPSTALVQRTPAATMDITHGTQPMPTNRHATSLQMTSGGNLFNRFVKVTQANANRVLQSLEAPEKIMNQVRRKEKRGGSRFTF